MISINPKKNNNMCKLLNNIKHNTVSTYLQLQSRRRKGFWGMLNSISVSCIAFISV